MKYKWNRWDTHPVLPYWNVTQPTDFLLDKNREPHPVCTSTNRKVKHSEKAK